MVSSILQLRPFQAIAHRLIDAGVFRHSLEERLKRKYIVLEPTPAPSPQERLDRRAAGG
jgi:hypothetical protein